MRSYTGIVLVVFWASLVLNTLGPGQEANADTWRGTAPFCNGSCLPGETVKGTSKSGDGATCVTGHKVLCGNAQNCPARDSNTSCYGVVEICDDGYYGGPDNNPSPDSQSNAPQNAWHSCSKYACGVCLMSLSANTAPNDSAAVLCKQGFVWRDAIPGDYVCVTSATRNATATDNAAAASRRSPDGGAFGPDTCVQGYVWRGVTALDHVCVTTATREQVQLDNAAAAQRVAEKLPFGPLSCKQGFVWREAIDGDKVCVTPETRTQASIDNSLAASRRAKGGNFGPDTCIQGFVWRGVVPSDHVCVTQQTHLQAMQDNSQADQREAVD